MKEKVFEAFANLGFKLEDADGMGYVFDYEGLKFLYLYNEDDEDFLNISLPGIYDYDEEKAGQYCALAENLNSSLKYVKAYTLSGSMWLFYERELFGGEDLETIISRMVLRLEVGLMLARKAIARIEASFAKDDGGDDEGNCEEKTDDNE